MGNFGMMSKDGGHDESRKKIMEACAAMASERISSFQVAAAKATARADVAEEALASSRAEHRALRGRLCKTCRKLPT